MLKLQIDITFCFRIVKPVPPKTKETAIRIWNITPARRFDAEFALETLVKPLP
jgi:hypothetical protein